jgi:integrase
LWAAFDRLWSKQASSRDRRYTLAAMARSVLGQTPADAIDYKMLNRWVSEQLGTEDSPGLAPATVNRKLSMISVALGELVKEGSLASMPTIPWQPENDDEARWLTPEEEGELMETAGTLMTEADARVFRALFGVLVDTGGRLSETLRAAKAGAFDRNQVVFKNWKSGKLKKAKSRAIPLTNRAYEGLLVLQEAQGKQTISKGWWGRQMERVRNAAGMPDVHLHTLRHTCLSRLVQAGMSLYMVQRWAGHNTIQITERYAHLGPSSLLEGAALLEAPEHGTDSVAQAAESGGVATMARHRAHLSIVK